jgi:hypothetical protein
MSTPKRYPTTRALLDELLEGSKPFGKAELDVVRRELDEDDFLDFKGGKGVRAEKLKELLWENVTGFSNAAGGVLVLGVSDKRPRRVEGVGHAVPGSEEPRVWAQKILGTASARIAPPPRFIPVQVGKRQVLVVATASASPQLIPLPGRDPRYAMRIGESTQILPPHLVADLLVGRRAQPSFEVSPESIQGNLRGGQPEIFGIQLTCRIENESFVYAKRVVLGCIVDCLYGDFVPRPARRILQEIEHLESVGAVKGATNLLWQLHHPVSSELEVLRPFQSEVLQIPTTGRGILTNLPFVPDSAYLQFALYVLAEGAPPTWYQGTLEYVAGGSAILRPLAGTPTLERLVGRRPVVSWRERGV